MADLRKSLLDAKKRNPDAYKIIGVLSGYGEKRIREIAEGKKPTIPEEIILEAMSKA